MISIDFNCEIYVLLDVLEDLKRGIASNNSNISTTFQQHITKAK